VPFGTHDRNATSRVAGLTGPNAKGWAVQGLAIVMVALFVLATTLAFGVAVA
jgi:hypothetical protein